MLNEHNTSKFEFPADKSNFVGKGIFIDRQIEKCKGEINALPSEI